MSEEERALALGAAKRLREMCPEHADELPVCWQFRRKTECIACKMWSDTVTEDEQYAFALPFVFSGKAED